MARPKKPDDERKDVVVKFRCTSSEKKRLQELAEFEGYDNISNYIRATIMGVVEQHSCGSETDFEGYWYTVME